MMKQFELKKSVLQPSENIYFEHFSMGPAMVSLMKLYSTLSAKSVYKTSKMALLFVKTN